MTTTWVNLLGAAGKSPGRSWGPGAGEPLILLHGGGGYAENFTRNILVYARYFHVFALDAVWFGLGPQPPFQEDIMAAFLDHIIDFMDWQGFGPGHAAGARRRGALRGRGDGGVRGPRPPAARPQARPHDRDRLHAQRARRGEKATAAAAASRGGDSKAAADRGRGGDQPDLRERIQPHARPRRRPPEDNGGAGPHSDEDLRHTARRPVDAQGHRRLSRRPPGRRVAREQALLRREGAGRDQCAGLRVLGGGERHASARRRGPGARHTRRPLLLQPRRGPLAAVRVRRRPQPRGPALPHRRRGAAAAQLRGGLAGPAGGPPSPRAR